MTFNKLFKLMNDFYQDVVFNEYNTIRSNEIIELEKEIEKLFEREVTANEVEIIKEKIKKYSKLSEI